VANDSWAGGGTALAVAATARSGCDSEAGAREPAEAVLQIYSRRARCVALPPLDELPAPNALSKRV